MTRITHELKEYALGWDERNRVRRDLTAIADRIDVEHESACAEAYGNGVKSVALPDMTAYVKLPVDVDGVPINIGDVMVYADGNTCPLPVVALVPPAVFLTDDGPRYADMCRHAPDTWERIIEELLQRGHDDYPLNVDIEPYVARCKALCERTKGEA